MIRNAIPRIKDGFQNAWVVPDLQSAMKYWVEDIGVGPWFTLRPNVQNARYRGNAINSGSSTTIAVSWMGDLEIELIQPDDDRPSVYRDTVPAGRTSFHHICVWTDNLDRAVNAYREEGFVTAFEGNAGSLRFAYVDTSPMLGCMIEILEENPDVRARFEVMKTICANWDGSDPVRARPTTVPL
jgi:hypothetical protein